jgi:hypothetical protein
MIYIKKGTLWFQKVTRFKYWYGAFSEGNRYCSSDIGLKTRPICRVGLKKAPVLGAVKFGKKLAQQLFLLLRHINILLLWLLWLLLRLLRHSWLRWSLI